MPVVRVEPVIDISVRGLCRHPYYNHPKGCPNWGKRTTCPPQARIITDVLDLEKPIYAAYNVFDFVGHCDRMQTRHPGWSEHQVKCVLYWQGTARKSLRSIVREFLQEHPGLLPVYVPEACGVDVTATMANVGIRLEWPPIGVTYQVALLGSVRRKDGDTP